jgi:hypothetical protein
MVTASARNNSPGQRRMPMANMRPFSSRIGAITVKARSELHESWPNDSCLVQLSSARLNLLAQPYDLLEAANKYSGVECMQVERATKSLDA